MTERTGMTRSALLICLSSWKIWTRRPRQSTATAVRCTATPRSISPSGRASRVTIAFCLDPDGNRIELVEHRDEVGRTKHADFLGAGALGWPAPFQQLPGPAKAGDPEWS